MGRRGWGKKFLEKAWWGGGGRVWDRANHEGRPPRECQAGEGPPWCLVALITTTSTITLRLEGALQSAASLHDCRTGLHNYGTRLAIVPTHGMSVSSEGFRRGFQAAGKAARVGSWAYRKPANGVRCTRVHSMYRFINHHPRLFRALRRNFVSRGALHTQTHTRGTFLPPSTCRLVETHGAAPPAAVDLLRKPHVVRMMYMHG